MAEIQGAEILVRALQTNGVGAFFDLPGDPVGRILSIGREHGVKTYSFRHEQASAMAAQAYGFVRREVGVSIVASGPAMTNAITGLATAESNGWPMLLIGGASELYKSGQGDFQEMPQVAAAAPFCKWSVAMDNPRRIPWYVSMAIRKALGGRPGPVYLDFPSDVINATVDESEVEWMPAAGDAPSSLADPEQISKAAAALADAERPLLLIGEGAAWADASKEALSLVEKLQIPFVPAPMGKGVVPDDHPLNVGGARSYALQNADTVLLAGARFNWMFHFGKPPRFSPEVRVIEIQPMAEQLAASKVPDVALVGDVRGVLSQLADAVTPRNRQESPWLEALETERANNAAQVAPMIESEEPFTNFYRLFRAINEVAAPDVIVASDGESTQAVSRTMQMHNAPRHRLDAGPSGCMGVGVPYAIGAQIAAPQKQVICATGDYAFGWNGIEIETAVRYRLPILFVVANNGSVRADAQVFQMADYKGLDAIRYDKVMEAFGGHGEHVATVSQLRPALERAIGSGKTALVNVAVNAAAPRKPQKFSWLDRLGKMRYTTN